MLKIPDQILRRWPGLHEKKSQDFFLLRLVFSAEYGCLIFPFWGEYGLWRFFWTKVFSFVFGSIFELFGACLRLINISVLRSSAGPGLPVGSVRPGRLCRFDQIRWLPG